MCGYSRSGNVPAVGAARWFLRQGATMLVITFIVTVGALVILINKPRWYAKWEIEPWLFKWVLGGVIVVYAVAFVLTYASVIK